jgi:hypothetical protein
LLTNHFFTTIILAAHLLSPENTANTKIPATPAAKSARMEALAAWSCPPPGDPPSSARVPLGIRHRSVRSQCPTTPVQTAPAATGVPAASSPCPTTRAPAPWDGRDLTARRSTIVLTGLVATTASASPMGPTFAAIATRASMGPTARSTLMSAA